MKKDNPTPICMIVQEKNVRGGIAAVTAAYYGSKLEKDFDVTYVESFCDGSKFKKIRKEISAIFAFSRVLRTKRPALVHMHTSFGGSFYRSLPFIFLARKKGIRIVNHIHSSYFDTFYVHASPLKKALVKKAWSACDFFIVLTDYWKKTFSCVIPEEKMEVIGNYGPSIPFEKNKPCRHRLLFLGAFSEKKGAYDCVDLFAKVVSQMPEARLTMAGDGERQALMDYAAKRRLRDQISFPGWVRGEEKEKLLRESDLLLLPSHAEGFPMSIIEGMAYGLPIVASKVGGIPQIVSEGENGFLFTCGDTSSMADAVLLLLRNSSLREQFRQKSYSIEQKHYTFDQHLNKLEQVYRKVLALRY